MSIELQRAYIKEIKSVIDNWDRIINDDYDTVNKQCEEKMLAIYKIIEEEI